MAENNEIVVTAENAGIRIDVYLTKIFSQLSRSFIQKLIEEKAIMVNYNPTRTNYKLRSGDLIDVSLPEPKMLKAEAENIPLDILYEDKALIVLNKPQDMVVHPAAGHDGGTVVNALLYHCQGELSGINGVLRPGIVHRIDKDTSGVIVAAKTDGAHRFLADQFKNHSVHRVYESIVFGCIKEEQVTVDQPIGRHPVDRKKMCVNHKNGRNAVTHIKVINRYKKYTGIEARLETGRTHQIRVHTAYIGHPVVGDTVYSNFKQPFKLIGQVLHARTLGFIHPQTLSYMEFHSPVPDYFMALKNKL